MHRLLLGASSNIFSYIILATTETIKMYTCIKLLWLWSIFSHEQDLEYTVIARILSSDYLLDIQSQT